MDYRYGSHTVYNIEYHFVWVTKYRYQVLNGDVSLRVRELVRQTCEAFEIKILSGVVSKDHVHIVVSAPPNIAPSEIMRRVKGRSARKLFEEMIKNYLEHHFEANPNDNFKTEYGVKSFIAFFIFFTWFIRCNFFYYFLMPYLYLV